ncbi:hypothetical protein MASR2M79_07790 [Aminivibrio sp.]
MKGNSFFMPLTVAKKKELPEKLRMVPGCGGKTSFRAVDQPLESCFSGKGKTTVCQAGSDGWKYFFSSNSGEIEIPGKF